VQGAVFPVKYRVLHAKQLAIVKVVPVSELLTHPAPLRGIIVFVTAVEAVVAQ
jgi:hypothetical protein